MKFLKHIDCPEGTSVLPGSVVLKTWKVKNNGQT